MANGAVGRPDIRHLTARDSGVGDPCMCSPLRQFYCMDFPCNQTESLLNSIVRMIRRNAMCYEA